jgi:hypothetical protein
MKRDRERALEVFEEAFDKSKCSYSALHVATLAQQLGDTKLRDRALKTIAARHAALLEKGKKPSALQELAMLFHRCLGLGGEPPGGLDLDAVDSLVESSSWSDKPILLYFAGYFLEARHGSGKGREYLRRAALCEATQWCQMLARDYLRRQGVEVSDVKPVPSPGSIEPSEQRQPTTTQGT